jgi:hypothetical protein
VEANIARWQSQFTSPDGQPVKPILQHLTVSGMPVTTVELTGSYARSVGMGPQSAPRPDQTLLVALVETGNLRSFWIGVTVRANRDAFGMDRESGSPALGLPDSGPMRHDGARDGAGFGLAAIRPWDQEGLPSFGRG